MIEQGILCDTEEEWEAVKKEMNAEHPRWKGMAIGEESTIIIGNGDGWCGPKHAKKRGYTIIPASEYLREEEFKVGDRVECIEGKGANKGYDLPQNSIQIISSARSVGLHLEGYSGCYSASRFKKAPTKLTNKPIREESNMNVNSTVAKVFKDVDDAILVTTYLGREYEEGSHRSYLALKANDKVVLTEAKRLDKEAKKDK